MHFRNAATSILLGTAFAICATPGLAETGALTPSIENVRNSNAVLFIAAFDKAGPFQQMDVENAAAVAVVPAVKGKVSVTFHTLPRGAYAIAALHDEDGAGDLDVDGEIPTEGYGFAAMGRSGLPPKFKDAVTDVRTKATQSLTLKYWT